MEILCRIRDIYRSIAIYELHFESVHNMSLNEGMLLCSLCKEQKLSSGQIAKILNLSNSNTSKVIRSVENKKLVKRILGNTDKRQMYFSLTQLGKEKLEAIQCEKIDIPDLLQSVLENGCLE